LTLFKNKVDPNEDQTRYRTWLSRFINLSTKQDDISILIGFFRNEKLHDAKSYQTIKLIAKAYKEEKRPVPTVYSPKTLQKKAIELKVFFKVNLEI